MSKLVRFFFVLALFAFLTTCIASGQTASQAAPLPQTIKLNVFALVSENLETMARNAGEAVHAEEGLDAYPAMGYQVHCTLYMTQYSPEKTKTVQGIVASLAETVRPFPVRAAGISATKDFWMFINLDRGRNLQTLSDTVVQSLSGHRFPSDFIPEWVKQYPQKLEYITKYGSPNVFAEFEPHLTILAKSDPQKVGGFLERHADDPAFGKPRYGQVIGIGIGEADRAGQIKTPLAVYRFRGK
ncbi:MAG TPA: DUF1045 domain-containing protein [Candidatus Ozemobacteraceae bacterium]|nr:DUF1045 domain-containing protein [Candidatus Ozemobacteraceae bacterium]